MRSFALVILGILLGACTPQRMITQLEYEDATLHAFPGLTVKQVTDAARTVLVRLDGEDFEFQNTRVGFVGRREWFNFMLIAAEGGTDQWEFRIGQDNGVTKARIEITRTASGGVVTPFGGGVYNQPQTIFNGTAIYEIFWARVDYMLGRRQTWMTCDEMSARIRAKTSWGNTNAICSGNTEDEQPGAPMIPYAAPGPRPAAGPATGT